MVKAMVECKAIGTTPNLPLTLPPCLVGHLDTTRGPKSQEHLLSCHRLHQKEVLVNFPRKCQCPGYVACKEIHDKTGTRKGSLLLPLQYTKRCEGRDDE